MLLSRVDSKSFMKIILQLYSTSLLEISSGFGLGSGNSVSRIWFFHLSGNSPMGDFAIILLNREERDEAAGKTDFNELSFNKLVIGTLKRKKQKSTTNRTQCNERKSKTYRCWQNGDVLFTDIIGSAIITIGYAKKNTQTNSMKKL